MIFLKIHLMFGCDDMKESLFIVLKFFSIFGGLWLCDKVIKNFGPVLKLYMVKKKPWD